MVPFVQSVAAPAPVMLAEDYRGNIDVGDYWVSEKLDGVRARWDGQRLVTRGGYAVNAPQWFVRGWPGEPLDGELWLGNGRFAEVSALIRRYDRQDADWRDLRFMVFDLPARPAAFGMRRAQLEALLRDTAVPWLQAVEHRRVADRAELDRLLDGVVAGGGEGLMLHRDGALYRVGRSPDLLKYKRHQDAEAVVIGYSPGEGKYSGLVGALLVEDERGRRFRLGSGLSDAERASPPPLGARVTYRFNGQTVNGLPRFARFLRVRGRE
ncbi:ATP-dependent DNA ligase [Marinobacterium nitratireducens]|uniref:ATP-dependent DNA ligase n=2 Tax=Marinobacterium nitratireducens TaxID=518897 RepID=A0A917ZM36_9GAMM|nr:ATP-dependent DNA ligase [Marinobacterium nitratireducens]